MSTDSSSTRSFGSDRTNFTSSVILDPRTAANKKAAKAAKAAAREQKRVAALDDAATEGKRSRAVAESKVLRQENKALQKALKQRDATIRDHEAAHHNKDGQITDQGVQITAILTKLASSDITNSGLIAELTASKSTIEEYKIRDANRDQKRRAVKRAAATHTKAQAQLNAPTPRHPTKPPPAAAPISDPLQPAATPHAVRTWNDLDTSCGSSGEEEFSTPEQEQSPPAPAPAPAPTPAPQSRKKTTPPAPTPGAIGKTDMIIEILAQLEGCKVEAATVVIILEKHFAGRYIFSADDTTATQRKSKVNGIVRSHLKNHMAQGDAKIGKETAGTGSATRAFMWYISTAGSEVPPQAIANSDTYRAI
jgi:hypothetical protein